MGSAFGVLGNFMNVEGDISRMDADRQKAIIMYGQGEQNRTLLNMSADSTLDKGAYQAGVIGIRGSQAVARQTLGYANSGVDTQSGSALDVAGVTRMLSKQDQNMMMANAAKSAWGLKVRGQQAYLQGVQGAMGAFNDQEQAGLQAVGDSAKLVSDFGSSGMNSSSANVGF